MSELIAVDGATVKSDVSVDDSGASYTITPPTNIEKAQGNNIFAKEMNVIANSGLIGLGGTCTQNAPANFKIEPAVGRNVKAGGELVLHKGDKNLVPVTVNGQLANSSPCTFPCTLEIDDPGQDKVESN